MHELIQKRWSPRAFEDRAVEQEKLETMFEAASWAPSSSNEQPWRYIYAHRSETEAFQRLVDCLVPSNQVWASKAAVLMVSLGKTINSKEKPNRFHLHDTGAANVVMALEAAALGLEIHQMGGYDIQKTMELLEIPEGYETASFIAVGYVGNPESLPEDYKQRETAPRKRNPVSSFVFKGKFPS
jgi:nitroreductase